MLYDYDPSLMKTYVILKVSRKVLDKRSPACYSKIAAGEIAKASDPGQEYRLKPIRGAKKAQEKKREKGRSHGKEPSVKSL
jgi:hypothetical protein